jgi:hypothetical protein
VVCAAPLAAPQTMEAIMRKTRDITDLPSFRVEL